MSEEFSAHSTKTTVVSVAFDKGIPVLLADIMRTADWSSDSVFKKFYYKLSVNANRFAKAVLSHDCVVVFCILSPEMKYNSE